MNGPMTEAEVVALMKTSRNEDEWNANVDKMKERNGGYPSFWYPAIMLSGLAHQIQQGWMSEATTGLLPKDYKANVIVMKPPTPEEIEEIKRRNN